MAPTKPRIAIACQGGGSHTAFTAGALKRFLRADGYELVAFTGTSGGAIDALLAWYGLLQDGGEKAGERLEAFWRDISARSSLDLLLNDWSLWAYRALSTVVAPEVSPYLYPPWASERLKSVLEDHVDFADIPRLVANSQAKTPMLLVGAVNVQSGEFCAFRNEWNAKAGAPSLNVTADAILASAAIPTLFRAVHVDGGPHWDGLFSQNPPIRELPGAGPDEIWIVQINPMRRESEPRSMADIRDRRNELAGNLSLKQEVFFIEKINELVKGDEKGNKLAPGGTYRPIKVRTLEMKLGFDLDSESKLDRSPEFINSLLERGEAQADEFLQALETSKGR